MSRDAAVAFLKQEKADPLLIEQVAHCIDAHHGTIAYQSKEAEIVANADCCRFWLFVVR